MHFAALQLYFYLSLSLLVGLPQRAQEARDRRTQPHLGVWLQRHENLPPLDRERALAAEPGFTQLSPQAQQRLIWRLHELDRMAPERRQRTLDRVEAMEHLTPQAREQIRIAAKALHALPGERQRAIGKIFRSMRARPPAERHSLLRLLETQGQLSGKECGMLSRLLTIEPYYPW